MMDVLIVDLIGYTLTSSVFVLLGLSVYFRLYPEAQASIMFKRFAETDVGYRYLESWSETTDRLLLGCPILAIMLMVILNASHALPDGGMGGAHTLLDLGAVTISVYEVCSYMICIWMFKPFLSATLSLFWNVRSVRSQMEAMAE